MRTNWLFGSLCESICRLNAVLAITSIVYALHNLPNNNWQEHIIIIIYIVIITVSSTLSSFWRNTAQVISHVARLSTEDPITQQRALFKGPLVLAIYHAEAQNVKYRDKICHEILTLVIHDDDIFTVIIRSARIKAPNHGLPTWSILAEILFYHIAPASQQTSMFHPE